MESRRAGKTNIQEIEKDILERLGEDYAVLHNGELSWTIMPKIKEAKISGTIKL